MRRINYKKHSQHGPAPGGGRKVGSFLTSAPCIVHHTVHCTLLCSQLYRWASETLKILHGCTETSQIQHGGTICRMERIDKVWTCKVCGKKDQLNKSNIKKHIEGVHLEGASYTCDLCGAIARSKNGLQIHIFRNHRS